MLQIDYLSLQKRAVMQAQYAAKEQQAADRLAAAQRDVGDLQVG